MRVEIDGIRYVPATPLNYSDEALMHRMWLALIGSGSSNRLSDADYASLAQRFGTTTTSREMLTMHPPQAKGSGDD